MFEKIDKLLFEPLVWDPIQGELGKFFTTKYSASDCWLQMNDFPDQPLWTLFCEGKSKEIEDTPKRWKINYSN